MLPSLACPLPFSVLVSNNPFVRLQVTSSSAFSADLGLDSLDAVEVVMAIEEEFNIVRFS